MINMKRTKLILDVFRPVLVLQRCQRVHGSNLEQVQLEVQQLLVLAPIDMGFPAILLSSK